MKVNDLLEMFLEPDLQKIVIYDLNMSGEVFEGLRDELPDRYKESEVESIDTLLVPTEDVYKRQILRYEDIELLQQVVRKLREKGAKADNTCGIHVHVDATAYTAKNLWNLVNIMSAKEDIRCV